MFFYRKLPTDPYSTNVSLLLKFDGPNNSTSFIDSSANNISVVGVGAGVKITTDDSKFGGSSVYFSGDNSSLDVEHSDVFAFGTGDYTIEFWMKTTKDNSDSGYESIFYIGGNSLYSLSD